jgi:hypothetical protein
MKFHSLAFVIASAVVLPWPVDPAQAVEGGFQPAMIGGGADSIASKLHYPPKERAANRQAAVAFNCEVRTDGKPSQIDIRCDRKLSRFGDAVYVALRGGRFVPAQAGGKVVPVTIGGTVLFTIDGGKPTVAISLATAEAEKIVSRQNYIQPQMIGGPEFRRKLFHLRYQYLLEMTKDPGAEVLAQVDAQGNLTGIKLLAESPPKGGWGRLLVKTIEGQKFIPATKNGQSVAGAFNLILNVRNFRDPDAGPRTGTLIKDDDVR